jgi:hypothetical protein
MPSRPIVFSELDVDELLELIHSEETPPKLRAKALRYLKKNSPTAE